MLRTTYISYILAPDLYMYVIIYYLIFPFLRLVNVSSNSGGITYQFCSEELKKTICSISNVDELTDLMTTYIRYTYIIYYIFMHNYLHYLICLHRAYICTCMCRSNLITSFCIVLPN